MTTRQHSNSIAKDAQAVGVEATFRIVFHPLSEPKEFGSTAKGHFGLSDTRPGLVQWSAWYDYRHTTAMLAVNLEGMKGGKDDWPVAVLIQNELAHQRFPELFAILPQVADVQVTWNRDAWLKYKVPIREKYILDAPAQRVDKDRWRSALVEAAACLADDKGGRATQKATLPHKGSRDLAVAPHLQFRTPLWSTMPAGHQTRAEVMTAKRDLLMPLYLLARSQASEKVDPA